MANEEESLYLRTLRITRFMGDIIRQTRLKRDLTIEETAEMTGISRQNLWRVENGFQGSAIATYIKLLLVLGITDDIFRMDSVEEFSDKKRASKRPKNKEIVKD